MKTQYNLQIQTQKHWPLPLLNSNEGKKMILINK